MTWWQTGAGMLALVTIAIVGAWLKSRRTQREEGWIDEAWKRGAAKLDNPEMDEPFAHEVTPAD